MLFFSVNVHSVPWLRDHFKDDLESRLFLLSILAIFSLIVTYGGLGNICYGLRENKDINPHFANSNTCQKNWFKVQEHC